MTSTSVTEPSSVIPEESRGIHEECGVFGIFSPKRTDVAPLVYYGLYALQHRGQESAGIAVNDDGVFSSYKAGGLVGDVFTPDRLASLPQGNIAIGHARYSTSGSDRDINAQPIIVNHFKGRLALAHNGNLTNSYELRQRLEERGSIFHTTTDSEAIAYIVVQERLKVGSIEEAVARTMDQIEGAYAMVVMSPTKLIAARDPYGFRPLCLGRRDDGSIVVASESCALDAVGATFVRDVEPGELVTISPDGITSNRERCGIVPRSMCVFEYIYFARNDSIIDGASVHEARVRAGEFLAQEHPVDADVVIGVPDSGLDAAIGYARMSGIPYALGFTKNKYIGRTFIAPDQKQRDDSVSIKLNPIRAVVEGRRVVVVDDSIVRGTTSRRTVQMLRRAGATEVHMRISAPPFVAPCYYGVDIDSADKLIANQHTVEEIAQLIGADTLGYLSVEHTMKLTGQKDAGFCAACFGEPYPTAVPTHTSKNRFEQKIHGDKDADE
jgi:amidophosphoribosyltransferase